MTSGDRPVRARHVLAGLGAVAVIVVAVVAGLELLVQPGDIEPTLLGPVGDVQCATLDVQDATAVLASELIECPRTFDGREVSYRGEVVRAVLRRGDRAWVQVNDDPYALDIGPLPEHRTAVGGNSGVPVSIPLTAAEQIRHVGSYRAHGDIIEVTGVFHRADPSDGGGPTIQATDVTIEQVGRPIHRSARVERVVAAAVLALVALGLAGLSRSSARAG